MYLYICIYIYTCIIYNQPYVCIYIYTYISMNYIEYIYIYISTVWVDCLNEINKNLIHPQDRP